MARVSAIVVTYNSAAIVARCLESLGDPQCDIDIVVVDNASTDDSVQVCRKTVPTARVIQMHENVGFAAAVNVAASRVNCDYLLLINPDAYLQRGCLNRLVTVADSFSNAGAVAPLVMDGASKRLTLDAGNAPTIWHMAMHSLMLNRLPWLRWHGFVINARFRMVPAVVSLAWASACCLLVRKAAFDRVGGMTERWFMYGEDVDFGLQLADIGLETLLATSARAIHVGGGSSAGGVGMLHTQWLENIFELYCLRERPGLFRRATWRALTSVGFIFRYATMVLVNSIHRTDVYSVSEKRRMLLYARAAVLAGCGVAAER